MSLVSGSPVSPGVPCLLLCDDDIRALESTRALLAAKGWQVHAVDNGQDALTRLRERSYDLLLLDLNMPGFSGYQVLDAIRETGLDVGVVIISGESSIEGAIDCLRRGAQDYLRKPYRPEELLARTQTALRERELLCQNRRMQQQIRESEQLHRFFVESAPDLIYLLDDQGRFLFTNQRIEKLLGYRRDELLGQPYTAILHPDDLHYASRAFQCDEGHTQMRPQTELRFLHKDRTEHARTFEAHGMQVALGSAAASRRGIYGVARDVSERKRAEEIIRFQSSHDLLTRLPNRVLFKDRIGLALTQAQRDKRELVVMYIDLDRFKLVNDTLGHLIGDELLQAVSLRMKDLLREGDTLARVGGDEFLLLLPGVGSESDAALIANKLIQELERPFQISSHQLYVTASIGIASYPRDGTLPDVLIRKADTAMYDAKSRGRHAFRFFHHDMEDIPKHKLTLTHDLHHAVDADQLRLHYQPQIDVRTGRISGLEALVRWQHPSLGLLTPGEFLPIAEESGLIGPIGQWVLKTACTDLRQWRNNGTGEIRVAVNFSASQVERPDFVNMVLKTLERCSLPSSALEIELTEDSIIKDIGVVVGKLALLADTGVRVAIDDFGVGYSSLSYLRKLPIHTLKIDRSFVQDIRSERDPGLLVSAIVSMAGGLTLNSIAEGVENESQMNYLRQIGCFEMQGYLFSRAVDASTMTEMLRDQPFLKVG